MQIGFEGFLTAPRTTSNDSDFMTEVSESANERADVKGAAAFPSQIDARIVTQIKNLHLIPTCSKSNTNCTKLRSMEKQVSILYLIGWANRSQSSDMMKSLSSDSA